MTRIKSLSGSFLLTHIIVAYPVILLRGGEVVSRQPHKLKIIGSSPVPASINIDKFKRTLQEFFFFYSFFVFNILKYFEIL